MHFVRTCVIIFIITFSSLDQRVSQKIVKVIQDEIYSKLFEMYKGTAEAVTGGVLWENVYLDISQNSHGNNCVRVSFLIKLCCNFIEKETLTQLFSCEFCKISKNTFFTEHLRTTASGTEKVVLVKFMEVIRFSWNHVF